MDENLRNQVDRLFQDPLKSHREDISPAVWNRIEEQLDKDDELLLNINKKKHLWIIASLVVFLTGVGAFGFFALSIEQTHSCTFRSKQSE